MVAGHGLDVFALCEVVSDSVTDCGVGSAESEQCNSVWVITGLIASAWQL